MTKQAPPAAGFYVVSWGGVGSKTLIKGLARDRGVEAWRASHWHWRAPPAHQSKHTPLIYVFGDPRDSIVSFFKRRELIHAGHGFVSNVHKASSTWAFDHCRNIGGRSQEFSPDWDLADFVASGTDFFGLEEHFDNWLRDARGLPVLFLRYESMWDNILGVCRFAGLPDEVARSFPPRVARAADWRAQGASTRAGLQALYGAFAERLAGFPDAFPVAEAAAPILAEQAKER